MDDFWYSDADNLRELSAKEQNHYTKVLHDVYRAIHFPNSKHNYRHALGTLENITNLLCISHFICKTYPKNVQMVDSTKPQNITPVIFCHVLLQDKLKCQITSTATITLRF
jgi:hypothetical protein